jgi:VWFA-related protein
MHGMKIGRMSRPFTKSIYRITALILGTFVAASGQTTPAVSDANPAQPAYQLKATVTRTFVDVVVTDRKGHPVKGLTRDDFQVFEDGVPQALRGFDVHDLSSASAPKPDLPPHLPPNTFANLVKAPEDQPVTVILYDVLNTPLDAMPYAHEAMVKFIKDQKSGSRIAIFVLSDRLHMLQGFTDDETRLLEAINSKSARTQQSMQLQLDTSSSTAGSALSTEVPEGAVDMLGQLKSLETEESNYLLQQRLELTVESFSQIARFVSALPGRKNLIWLSGSFPSAVLPDSDPTLGGTANEFGGAIDLGQDVKEAEDLLNKSHVSVYPVDVRGLKVSPQFSASTNSKGPPSTKPDPFANQQAAEHSTMDEVADNTGGHAFYNTNGLKQAMDSAMEDGGSYYSLFYAPTNTKQDGTLRRVKVQLRQPGYQLSYRRSYFADGTPHPEEAAQAGPNAPEHNLLLDNAMQHGAPVSSQLFLEASVNPVGGAMTATPKEMESLSEFIALKKKRGSKEPPPAEPLKVQHYEVSYAVLGRQLSLPPAGEGKCQTNMTFALGAYSPDSLLVNGYEVSVKNAIPAAQCQKIKTQGYHANMIFAVPVAATALRLAARDGIGDRIGSLEVPLPIAPANPAPQPAAPEAKP